MHLHVSHFPLICWIRASEVELSRGSGVLPSFSWGRIWGENNVTLLRPIRARPRGERLVDTEPRSPSLSSSVGSPSTENRLCVLHITTTKPKKHKRCCLHYWRPHKKLGTSKTCSILRMLIFPVSLNTITNRNLGSYIIAGVLTDRVIVGNVTASQLCHLHDFFFMHYP